MKKIIEFKKVYKKYGNGASEIIAANDINFSINEGEFVVVLGPSGAGKSTILNLLGGMDTVTSGEIIINGKNITKYNDDQLSEYRAEHIGFVFQFYNTIPTLTALENVELIKNISKNPLNSKDICERVGLGHRLNQFPAQLSGGEQQRISIARALCKNPTLLLCDEPTGALDCETGIQIISLLKEMCNEHKKTIVIVTHNAAFANVADKVIKIRNGQVQQITNNPNPMDVKEVDW